MSKQKRIMLLGGLRYLIPVIEVAHKQGYYVITADYLPNNIAHKFSDEYCNVSIVDKDAVLHEAQMHKIDGIMSFACDPGVVSASYVQNKMGLPSFGPYESVEILQNKDKFRKFLSENEFNVPWAKGYKDVNLALSESKDFNWPVIVKPTDSAGSKGVSRVDGRDNLKEAINAAIRESHSGNFIIEEFIDKLGCSSDSDSMSINGQLVVTTFNAQRFDNEAINPYVPAAYSWPSTYTKEQESYLSSEIQRLITLLGMETALYNIETRVGTNGKPYIMEFTPRGGGNRLSEMVRYATKVDMITAITRATVGEPIQKIECKPYQGNWAEIIIHADREGHFQKLKINNETYKEYIVETDIWINKGEKVRAFEGANNAIGTLIMNFNSREELERALDNPKSWLEIEII